MNGYLARLGAEYKALYAYDVAYVEEFLEYYIIHILILARTEVVAAHIHLYASFVILKFHEGGLAHYAAAHYATGHNHLARRLKLIAERALYLG